MSPGEFALLSLLAVAMVAGAFAALWWHSGRTRPRHRRRRRRR